jgi:hypothetical protein
MVTHFQYLIAMAKRWGPAMKKKKFVKKLDHDFITPYQLVEELDSIEEALWKKGDSNNNIKSAFSWLHHRYVFLHPSTHGILRCESIYYKGELSDCLMLNMPGDPHVMKLLVQQLATGRRRPIKMGRNFMDVSCGTKM